VITEITVGNFGTFSTDKSVPLKGLTFLVGPNNSGKSTLLAGYLALATLNRRFGFQFPQYPDRLNIKGNFPSPFFQRIDPNNREGIVLGTLLKFQEGADATYARGADAPIKFTVKGQFETGEASLSLKLTGYPSFNTYEVSAAAPNKESLNQLYSALKNTWAFPSSRDFIAPSSSVGYYASDPITFGTKGINVIQFLLEKWTDRDERWEEAESWLKKLDPNINLLKSPLRRNGASIETSVKLQNQEYDFNIYSSGSGVQRALQIICAVVFSDPGSVIVIEEPEMNLHNESQNVLLDLFNSYVNNGKRQIIVSTHSWDLILGVVRDLGMQTNRRGDGHVPTNKESFEMLKLSRDTSGIDITEYDLTNKKFSDIRSDFNMLWGESTRHDHE